MNHLPTLSTVARMNALAAAAIVTLGLLSGIDAMASADSSTPRMAQAVVTNAA